MDGYTGPSLSLLRWNQHTGRTSGAATVTEAEAMKGVTWIQWLRFPHTKALLGPADSVSTSPSATEASAESRTDRLLSGASQPQRPAHPGRASVHLHWDETCSGYGFACPGHRASVSTSQGLPGVKARNSTGTASGHSEGLLNSSEFLGPGGLFSRDQQEAGLVYTMGPGRTTQVTPSVIMQGHRQRPHRRRA